jgi:hypothetical protein
MSQIPTALRYYKTGLFTWGLEAKGWAEPDDILCEWFKSYLDPVNLRSDETRDPDLPKLPVCSGHREAIKLSNVHQARKRRDSCDR